MSRRRELAFAQNLKAALDEAPTSYAWLHLLIITALIATAGLWAATATIEESTAGTGRVIPSQQLQIVQMPEAGVVTELLAQEGQTVKAGDLIMRIDATISKSQLGELRQKQGTLQAQILRLTAEAEEQAQITFPPTLIKSIPRVVTSERKAFRARLRRLTSELALLREQVHQREQEIEELNAKRKRLSSALVPLRKEVSLTRNLRKRGVVPEVDLLRLERQLAEMQGDLYVLEASIPRAKASIAEAKNRRENVRAIFRSEAREKLTRARADLAIIEETLSAAQLRVAQKDIRSPVDGVVNKLLVTTIGAVKGPGETVAEIVPVDDALLIEAQIRPQDVAFIHPGQISSVKLTAYDYLIYGALKGRVERIGADTFTDSQGQPYYRVIVRTERNFLEVGDKRLPAIPGMVAQVDIQTGEKTVLDYLLKPIRRVQGEAFRER